MSKLYTVFGFKELLAISGNKGSNLIWLVLIGFMALLVLGLAESTESFLKEKMDNPYVQLVEVNWPIECAREGVGLKKFQTETLGRFGSGVISGVHAIVKENAYFRHPPQKGMFGRLGLVSRQSDILYRLALEDSTEFISPYHRNTLLVDTAALGRKSFSAKEGVMVSRPFLRRLGYNDDATDIVIQLACGRDLTLPISAILKNLPSEVDVIMHSHLWEGIINARGSGMSDSTWNARIRSSESELFLLPEKMWLEASAEVRKSFSDERPGPDHTGSLVKRKKRRGVVPEAWESYKWVSPAEVLHLKSTTVEGGEIPWSPSSIGVRFSKTDSVRSFANYVQNDIKFLQEVCPLEDQASTSVSDCAIQEKAALKVDLSKIKAKEFLNLFNQIARLLRHILMASAAVLLILRCNALFELHVEKNRASLGTLKAFGLSNSKIIGLYASIAVLMLFGAFVIAMTLSSFIGPISLSVAKTILKVRPEDASDLIYFNLDFWMGLSAFVLFPITFVSLKIRRLLQLSPGALVFGRKSTSS